MKALIIIVACFMFSGCASGFKEFNEKFEERGGFEAFDSMGQRLWVNECSIDSNISKDRNTCLYEYAN